MNSTLNEIHLRRGRLLERIASQRTMLTLDAQPVSAAFDKADHVINWVRSGVAYVKQHPGVVTLAVAGLVIVNKGRFWRWAKRGFIAWKTFSTLRARFLAFGFQV
jgi:hypothetical protein